MSAMSDVPKTTVGFGDSLGLTELGTGLILVVVAYYSKGLESQVSEGKRHAGQHPRETRHELPVVSSSEVMRIALNPPSSGVQQHGQSIAVQGRPPNLGVQGFYWGSVT